MLILLVTGAFLVAYRPCSFPVHNRGPSSDKPRTWIGQGCELFTDSSRTRHRKVRGHCASNDVNDLRPQRHYCATCRADTISDDSCSLCGLSRTARCDCLDVPGMFPGHSRARLRGDSADAAQTISLDIARIARGCCPTCFLIFDKGMVSNQNTGFPIPESRTGYVRLNVSKFVRGCADHKALNGRSETGSEMEQVGSEMNGRR